MGVLITKPEEEAKTRKQVQFREEIEMHEIVEGVQSKRTWNDGRKRKEKLDRGQFTEAEVKTLMNALCVHVQQNDLGEAGLIDLCSKPKEELPDALRGAWCKIAESLPNRSV